MKAWQKRRTSPSLFPFGFKVGTTLGPAHGQGGEGVLDDLFEGEELQQSQIDRRVEPEATLERSDGAVHLDAIAAIDLDLAIVVDPADAEHDHSLGLDKPLEYLCFLVIGVPLDDGLEGSQHFTRSCRTPARQSSVSRDHSELS